MKIKTQISKEVTVIAEALGVTAKLFIHHFIKFNFDFISREFQILELKQKV